MLWGPPGMCPLGILGHILVLRQGKDSEDVTSGLVLESSERVGVQPPVNFDARGPGKQVRGRVSSVEPQGRHMVVKTWSSWHGPPFLSFHFSYFLQWPGICQAGVRSLELSLSLPNE